MTPIIQKLVKQLNLAPHPEGGFYREPYRSRGTIPAGHWFGAYPNPGTEFVLVTCVVIPGFDFKDFEMAERAELLKQHPNAKEEILRLTK